MFGYSFYREVLFFDTGSGKAVSVSFGEPGYSEETARNLQGDILESQRKYYGGYIHVGKRVFLENLDGFIGKTASGPKRPLRRGREWRQDTPLHLRRQSRIVRVPLPSGAVTGGNRSEVEGEDVGTGKADELEVFGNRKAYGLQRIIRSTVCQAGSVVVLAEMT